MKRELSHDEVWAALDAAALDALDLNDREAVLAHASSCAACRAELASLREAVGAMAYAPPPTGAAADPSVRARVRARLLARAAADDAARSQTVDAPHPIQWARVPRTTVERERVIGALAWRRAEWMAIAASVLLVVSVAVLLLVARDRSIVRETLTDRDRTIAGLTGPDVAVVDLAAPGAVASTARMFWDRRNNAWTFVGHNLPSVKPGRTLQLWLVTPTAKINAGTFVPSNGDAIVRKTYALARDSLRAVAVTDEPAGGVPQPTGPYVVTGTAATGQ